VCEPSQLNINLAPSGGAGGNEFYAFNVVNVSQQACPIGGYFGVSIYNPAGQLVSAADGREVGPSGPSQALDLAPNRTAANLPTGPHRETAQRRVRGSGRRHSGYDHHVIDVDSETSPEPLPRYGIERWTAPEPSRPGPWTASRTAHGVLYLNSASWTYSDPGGQAIEIGSLRLPLLVSVRAEAERIQRNLLYSYVGNVLGAGPTELAGQVQQIEGEILTGQRPWNRTTVAVDGLPVDFEVFDYGSDYWSAAGKSHIAGITIASRAVPIDDIALVQLDDYPMPTPHATPS
jgi:Protein of unknown function (DUF4232)